MATPDQIKQTAIMIRKIMPNAGMRADLYAGVIYDAMAKFEINNPRRQAAFLAQLAHESDELSATRENLNYSAVGLAKTWPNRFAERGADGKLDPTRPNALAKKLERKPEAIANSVYANRMGNGDEKSGDGYRFRGGGWFQVTGYDNFLVVERATGIPLTKQPELIETPEVAAVASAVFWKTNGLNAFADRNDFDGVSDIVNLGRKTVAAGDSIGYAKRLQFFKRAESAVA